MICSELSDCVKANLSNVDYGCGLKEGCLLVADTRSNVKCEEKGKVYILENPQRKMILQYRMDGGVVVADSSVPANTCKCDFLLVTSGKSAVLTELKGVDVMHAIEQIDGTLNLYKDLFKICKKVCGRIIITSSTPQITANPQYTKLLLRLKKMKGDLLIKEKKYSEYIE